jgi:hypothetical protein
MDQIGNVVVEYLAKHWVSPILIAIPPGIAAWLLQYLRPPRYLPDYEKAIRLVDDISKGDSSRPRQRLLIEEAWSKLYGVRLSLTELDLLERCERRADAVRIYVRYRHLLSITESGRCFEFRSARRPFRQFAFINWPYAFIVGTVVYFACMWSGLWLVRAILNVPRIGFGGDTATQVINAASLWALAVLLIGSGLVALCTGIARHQSDRILTEALGDVFISSRKPFGVSVRIRAIVRKWSPVRKVQ